MFLCIAKIKTEPWAQMYSLCINLTGTKKIIMLQLVAPKLLLYVYCFILLLLDSTLSTFSLFYFSSATRLSFLSRFVPLLTNYLIPITHKEIITQTTAGVLGRKWSFLLYMQNWTVIWLELIFPIQRKIFKSLNRNFTSLKKKKKGLLCIKFSDSIYRLYG